MGKQTKYHFPGTVQFVTASVEEGILFPCNPLMNLIVRSALGAAQLLYPVKIVAFICEGSHIHLMLVVRDPDDVYHFMGHFKGETGHAVNRLLGRRKRTVWCEGYHSAPVLNVANVLQKLTYLYTNPVKDNLVESIDQYPGVSTWQIFQGEQSHIQVERVRRWMIEALPKDELSFGGFEEVANELREKSSERVTFRVFPDAWMDVFGIKKKKEREALNGELLAAIRRKEEEQAEQNLECGRSPMGAERLRSQGIDLTYIPDRKGYQAWCFCTGDSELRVRFIRAMKELKAKARDVFERWKQGDYSVPYPLGLYPPSLPKVAEPVEGAVFAFV